MDKENSNSNLVNCYDSTNSCHGNKANGDPNIKWIMTTDLTSERPIKNCIYSEVELKLHAKTSNFSELRIDNLFKDFAIKNRNNFDAIKDSVKTTPKSAPESNSTLTTEADANSNDEYSYKSKLEFHDDFADLKLDQEHGYEVKSEYDPDVQNGEPEGFAFETMGYKVEQNNGYKVKSEYDPDMQNDVPKGFAFEITGHKVEQNNGYKVKSEYDPDMQNGVPEDFPFKTMDKYLNVLQQIKKEPEEENCA